MSEEFKNFPTYKESKRAIEKLQNIVWPQFENFESSNEYIKEVEKIIYQEFDIIPSGLRLQKPKDFNLSIFRAREVNTIKNIDLISEHSYPPVNLTGFGRCNFPNNPVFYCSNHPITSLLEIIRNTDYIDKEYCLSVWGIINSESPICIQNYFHSELPKANGFSAIKDADILQLDKTFEHKLDPDKKAGLLELIGFLHSTFINDKSHKLSAAIAHQVLFAEHNFRTDILMYPSIQTKLTGMNMAIQPNFVDNQMQLKRLYFVKITGYNKENDSYNFSFGRYGYVEKNVIMWRESKKNDELFDKFYKDDFKGVLKRVNN